MRGRLATIGAAIATFLLIVAGPGNFAFADSNSGPPPVDGTISVALGSVYNDIAVFGSSLGTLTDSVSTNIYAVTGPATVAITVEDLFVVGDYFELWESSSPGFTAPTLFGTTPPVHTDANLVAPGANPLWDGAGSAHSTKTFIVPVPSGVTYFAVRDALQDAAGAALLVSPFPCGSISLSTLLSSGCSATGISLTGGVFLLAGLAVSFANAPQVGAPEFGLSPFLVAALALPLIVLLKARVRVSQ